MDCNTLLAHLSAYIDGELDDDLSQEAREHLATCHNCRITLDSTQRTILLYKDRANALRMSAETNRRLYDQIEAAFKTRSNADKHTG